MEAFGVAVAVLNLAAIAYCIVRAVRANSTFHVRIKN